MLTGKDFIVFSDNWGRHPFSCQHIMKNFIGENRVLWVNTIGMRNPRFTLYDFRRSADIVSGWCTPKKKHQCSAEPDNLTIIKPIMTPYHQISWIRAINNKSVFKSVSNKAAELGFRRPIIVTTLPHTAESVLMFDSAAVVYYCVDDFTFWPGINRSFILSMEELLLKKADLLFASADELCRKKERNGRRPHLLPHGVDFDHFNAGAVCSVSPEPLANISAPIVGFFGALSAWLDYELLSELAVLRPDWSFVYIGPADTDVSLLSRHPNVYLLGKVVQHILHIFLELLLIRIEVCLAVFSFLLQQVLFLKGFILLLFYLLKYLVQFARGEFLKLILTHIGTEYVLKLQHGQVPCQVLKHIIVVWPCRLGVVINQFGLRSIQI